MAVVEAVAAPVEAVAAPVEVEVAVDVDVAVHQAALTLAVKTILAAAQLS